MAPAYCEVALPVPLRTTFTYGIPSALAGAVTPGCRVVVPCRARALVGVVLEVDEKPRIAQKIRNVTEVLDLTTALPSPLIELGRWMSGYYLAPPGEIFRAMLPPAVEVRAERELSLTEKGREELARLAAREEGSIAQAAELAVLRLVGGEGKAVRFRKLKRMRGAKAALGRLVRRGAVRSREFAERREPRGKKIIAWNPAAASDAASAAEGKVRELLAATRGPLPVAAVREETGVSSSVLARLEREGKLVSWTEPYAEEFEHYESDFPLPANVLNAEQERVAGEIGAWVAGGEFTVGLLHGVTGSGKTEVYLRAVEEARTRGKTVLFLVPEIALTVWVSRVLRARCGDMVAVLHSSLPEGERARAWWRVRQGEAQVVVGTRSAVFAPVANLGLVVVDEEQEAGYKQEETPRYHGRDTAIMRAKIERAVVVLGSATPSMESFHHARSGKYRLLELGGRVENRPLAAVEVVDLRKEFLRTQRGAPVSEPLEKAIARRLDEGTQALVLINRRGYSWYLLCRSCGAAVQCENCSIALTFHKKNRRLICHYCGFTRAVPPRCLKCGSEHIWFVGQGVEQIEERLRELFPRARIGRLDRDVVRSRRACQQVLAAFAGGALDILVGTQMVAKGHDFHRVTLVGVLAADLLLGLPDFRAAERTFQLLTQVAGRAGRGTLPGQVLVETYYPEHYAIQQAARQDYAAFFETELRFRRMMHYPPFTALASVIVRDGKLENAVRWARALSDYFRPREKQGLKVLGPAAAPLARLRREYRFQFLLKAEKRPELGRVLSGCLDACAAAEIPERAVHVDVDPVNLM